MKKMNKALTAALVAAAALGVTACSAETASAPGVNTAASPAAGQTADGTIQVQTSESTKVIPDMAQIIFGVTSQGADPKECQEQNNMNAENIIAFLKEAGIDQKSIQTSNYGLSPIYNWENGQTITGYEMRTTFTVSDIPLGQVSTLLASAVEAGVNNIDSVSYLSSKYDESYQEALKKAIAASQVKAQVIAEASGRTLGEISSVQESVSYNGNRYTGYSASGVMQEAMDAKTMAVEPGQIDVEAQVNVTYKIK